MKAVISAIILAVFLSVLHYAIITPLLKTKAGLTAVNGIISAQQLVHVNETRSSFNAYYLNLENVDTAFAIQDNKDRAFNYLTTHNTVGLKATILYDRNAYNQAQNITYHVYGVTVNGFPIMTLSESKTFYKWGLLLLVFVDTVVILSYRRNKRKQLAADAA